MIFRLIDSSPGLLRDLINERWNLGSNIELVRQAQASGHTWVLRDRVDDGADGITGNDLVKFFKVVANRERAVPSQLQTPQLLALSHNPQFTRLARMIPGIETPEHREQRERLSQVKKRVIRHATQLGKGLNKITRLGLPGRIMQKDY